MPRNRSRAARRIALRTEVNAQARVAAGLVDPDAVPIRKTVRHKTQVEMLLNRGSITRAQERAASRLEAKWRAAGGVLGSLTAKYEPRFKDRKRSPVFDEDTAHSIACRLEFEGALQELGRWLAPVIVHVVLCDLPPADWARANGRPNPDALGLLRTGLDCLADYFDRPARDRRPRRDPPPPPPPAPAPQINGHHLLAPPEPVVVSVANGHDVEPSADRPTLGDYYTAMALLDAADDRLLELAIAFACRRADDPELAAGADRLAAIVAARRAPAPPAPPPARLRPEPGRRTRPGAAARP